MSMSSIGKPPTGGAVPRLVAKMSGFNSVSSTLIDESPLQLATPGPALTNQESIPLSTITSDSEGQINANIPSTTAKESTLFFFDDSDGSENDGSDKTESENTPAESSDTPVF